MKGFGWKSLRVLTATFEAQALRIPPLCVPAGSRMDSSSANDLLALVEARRSKCRRPVKRRCREACRVVCAEAFSGVYEAFNAWKTHDLQSSFCPCICAVSRRFEGVDRMENVR